MLSYVSYIFSVPHAAHSNEGLELVDDHRADITWLGHGMRDLNLVFMGSLP
jgi:hypothetical protein